MLRKFITLDEPVQFVNNLSDDEQSKVAVLPSENQGKVTDKKNNDKNLVKQNISLQDVARHLEVFHQALQVHGQDKNITPKLKISNKQCKVKWRSKKEFHIKLNGNEPGTIEKQVVFPQTSSSNSF